MAEKRHGTIGVVADIHLANHRRGGAANVGGVNQRARYILDALSWAAAAVEREDGVLAMAGDVFDTTAPAPWLVDASRRAVGQTPVVAILGNHDRESTARGHHSLASLTTRWTVLEAPRYVRHPRATWCDLMALPYAPEPAREYLPRAFAEVAERLDAEGSSRARVALIHAGVEDDQTAPWLRGAKDAIEAEALFALMAKHDVAVTVAGNWHDRRDWVSANGLHRIVQAGALVPTGFDNAGIHGYGGLILLRPSAALARGVEVQLQVIAGPRFLVVRAAPVIGGVAQDIEAQLLDAVRRALAKREDVTGCLFVQWKVPLAHLRAAQDIAARANATAEGGWEVEVAPADADEEPRPGSPADPQAPARLGGASVTEARVATALREFLDVRLPASEVEGDVRPLTVRALAEQGVTGAIARAARETDDGR